MKANYNKSLNYYQILNLEPGNIDSSVLRKQYRKLSKLHHPDKSGGDDTQFSLIAEAYQVLKDNTLKVEYDHYSRYGANYDETVELYDFEFSNENVNTNNYQQSLKKFKNQEMIDILVKLPEFQSPITITRKVTCKTCDGAGMDFEDHLFVFECDLCEGSGEWKNETCSSCGGRGENSMKQCLNCNGEKLISIEDTIHLQEEDFDNNKCKIKYKGNVSKDNVGKVGSLYLIIGDLENQSD